jgi:Tfp pilus assembly protein PilN
MVRSFVVKPEENRNYPKKHICTFEDVFLSPNEPVRILVSLKERIPSNVYGTKTDLTKLIISPHFQGSEVYPEIKPIPCHVYMAVPAEAGSWEGGPYRIVDWGIIEYIVE